MKQARLIIIGGSAGSLHVILNILGQIPPGYPIPILVVLHRNSLFESSLEELFASRTRQPIREVEEKDALVPGTIYISPADYHVLLEQDGTFSLDYSERVNFSRPSIDVTFHSAADIYGDDLVCCLLSGGNTDGTEGLRHVKEQGGIAIVQDPATADVPYMPQHAVTNVAVDFILTTIEIPNFIKELGHLPLP